jgi:hypothetical protein
MSGRGVPDDGSFFDHLNLSFLYSLLPRGDVHPRKKGYRRCYGCAGIRLANRRRIETVFGNKERTAVLAFPCHMLMAEKNPDPLEKRKGRAPSRSSGLRE